MTNYVDGFLFSQNLRKVALIRKSKPAWQKGLLNGIGGKVEVGETIDKAMVREFQEETGAVVESWIPFADMIVPHVLRVFFYTARGDFGLETTTDEPVNWYLTDEWLRGYKAIPNLDWLVPMARLKFTAPEWEQPSQFSFY